MSNALMTLIHAQTHSVTRLLRGEAVTLRDSQQATLVEIADAVVTLDPISPGRDSGPAERTGVLRLEAEHHADAVASHTCIVRDETFDVITVGKIHAGTFRVQISTRGDQNDHTNMFDIEGNQAVWGPEA